MRSGESSAPIQGPASSAARQARCPSFRRRSSSGPRVAGQRPRLGCGSAVERCDHGDLGWRRVGRGRRSALRDRWGWSSGRSHGVTRTVPRFAHRSAVVRPPSGPSSGNRSGTVGIPSASPAEPPIAATGSAPTARSESTMRAASGRPPISAKALSLPNRLDRPPQRIAPTSGLGRVGRSRRHPGRRPQPLRFVHSGSSWSRNTWQRSSSSRSPIAAAARRSPSRARRNPRFVSCSHRT